MKAKNLFLFLFATILSLVSFTLKANADTYEIGDLYYTLDDDKKEAIVRSHMLYRPNYDYTPYFWHIKNYDMEAIVIPSTVEHEGETYTVTRIARNAFYNCRNLIFLEIPNTVTLIDPDAIYGTRLEEDETNWTDGCLYINGCLIRANSNIKGKLTLKVDTRLIASNAFAACEGLTEIVIPNTLTEINEGAFEGCVNLTEINVPLSVKEIQKSTFKDCYKLKTVTLQKHLYSIYQEAFANCVSLRDIYCSCPVTYYGECFPEDVSKITVHAPSRYRVFYQKKWPGFIYDFLPFVEDGIYYDLNGSNYTATVIREKEGKDNYAALTGSVTIPRVIWDDDGVKFTISDIAEEAFSYAPIKKITVNSEIVSLPKRTFANAAKLTDAILPKTVARIENGAFEGCTALENIPGLTNTQKEFLPNLNQIGEAAFKGCTQLPKLWLESVTSIGKEAFSGCTALKNVNISAQLREIGEQAFAGCTKLEEVTNLAAKPQTFPDKLFDGIDKAQFVIYVHRTAYEAFKAATSWKDYNIQIIPSELQYFTIRLTVNDEKAGTVSGGGSYVEGTEVTVTATPKEGYHFVRWSEGETKASYSFKLTKDVSLQAIFEENEPIYYYDLKLQSNDETMGTVSGGGTHIEKWTVVDITATPKEGYEFMYWIDSNGVNRGRISSWMVTDDITFTAYFREKSTTKNYFLWVCGQQVTSDNCLDILNDGVWAYDHESRTLMTMKDAVYDLTDTEFLTDMVSTGGLTVVFNHRVDVTITQTGSTGRQAISNNKPLTFTGSTFKGLVLNVQNMYAGNFRDVFTITGHIDVSFYHKNTTEWGKSNIKNAFFLGESNPPTLVVDGATFEVMAGIGEENGYTVSNQTDQSTYLSLHNAVVESGSISAQSLSIADNSQKYKLGFATPELESICAVGGFDSYFEGTRVTLRALPETSYKFVRWSDGSTDNPYTFTMPAHDVLIDPVVEAEEIAPTGAFINADAPEGQGTIKDDFTGGWFDEGVVVTITVLPEEDYDFVKWSDGNTDNPRIITVEAGNDITIHAEFAQKERFTVTFLDWDNEVLKEEKVYKGEDATVPDQPYRQGYTFTGWDKDYTNVTADLTVKAQFDINVYTVRFFGRTGKQIGEDQHIEYGKAAVAPDAPKVEGYVFVEWDKFFDFVESDLDIYAVYELQRYKAEFTAGEHGSVAADRSDLNAIPYGETVKLVAVPEEHYETEKWSDGGKGDSREIVITSDTTINVTFVKKKYMVTFIGFGGATIKYEYVTAGEGATAPDLTAVHGYHFVEWDKPFDEIWENTTVTAIYEEDPVNIPENLKVVLTEIEGDTQLDFSWDLLEGAVSYTVGFGYGDEQHAMISTPTNSLTLLLSKFVKDYSVKPGTYTVRWFVEGMDKYSQPMGDWAEGESFEITVKDTGTSIDNMEQPSLVGQKLLINGHLFILIGDQTFDATGRLVK